MSAERAVIGVKTANRAKKSAVGRICSLLGVVGWEKSIFPLAARQVVRTHVLARTARVSKFSFPETAKNKLLNSNVSGADVSSEGASTTNASRRCPPALRDAQQKSLDCDCMPS